MPFSPPLKLQLKKNKKKTVRKIFKNLLHSFTSSAWLRRFSFSFSFSFFFYTGHEKWVIRVSGEFAFFCHNLENANSQLIPERLLTGGSTQMLRAPRPTRLSPLAEPDPVNAFKTTTPTWSLKGEFKERSHTASYTFAGGWVGVGWWTGCEASWLERERERERESGSVLRQKPLCVPPGLP